MPTPHGGLYPLLPLSPSLTEARWCVVSIRSVNIFFPLSLIKNGAGGSRHPRRSIAALQPGRPFRAYDAHHVGQILTPWSWPALNRYQAVPSRQPQCHDGDSPATA